MPFVQAEYNWLENVGCENDDTTGNVCKQESEQTERCICGTSNLLDLALE